MHVVSDFCFGHFWWSYGPCQLIPCPRNSCHIFYRIDLKLCWMFSHDLKIWMWFWSFSFLIFDKVMALCHFSNFWTVWPRKLNFGWLLVFDILNILIMVRVCWIGYWQSYSLFIDNGHSHKGKRVIPSLFILVGWSFIIALFIFH